MATVFTAELHAIHLALQHIQSKPHHHAVVYVDSLSALQALCSAVCWEHPMVCATRRLLRLLSSSAGSLDMLVFGGMTWPMLPLSLLLRLVSLATLFSFVISIPLFVPSSDRRGRQSGMHKYITSCIG
ncbi:hypothetical protein JGG62_23855 [Salmonella enterica subsp. enterica serovar Typhimurium]|nr:hypothetical protein [Salmonella enterica subsp. enterica serovar Typhimurium]